MKLRKLSHRNHPILGDINLDFCNSEGKPASTIIFAGENGCGKTTLLESIFELFPFNVTGKKSSQSVEIEMELTEEEFHLLFEPVKENVSYSPENIVAIKKDFEFVGNWNCFTFSVSNSDSELKEFSNGQIQIHNRTSIFRSLFSTVEVTYNSGDLSSVTAKDLDVGTNNSVKSSSDLATEISQLLIDVQSLDDTNISQWVEDHPGVAPPDEIKRVRVKRFTKAFSFMFPTKTYLGYFNEDGKKIPTFQEFGQRIPINKLSSGEKQIVFRGGFILKDVNSINGSFILIDEPEISLHPSWQLKITDFYKTLFRNESGDQTNQIFISTHSPFIIHNARSSDEKVIILKRSTEGKISVSDQQKFFGWSPEKIIEEAFSVSFLANSDRPIIFVEGETDEKYYLKCMELFGFSTENFEFKWIGRATGNGPINSGEGALNNAYQFFLSHPSIYKNKIVLLYDHDSGKLPVNQGRLFVRGLNMNQANMIFKRGIENLLVLDSSFEKDGFYRTHMKQDHYSGEVQSKTLDKMKLCNFLCNELELEKQKAFFSLIKTEIENIVSLVAS